jgi:hypothetical protein
MLLRMYTSPDDARSDLFLSGAVYLFGPLVLGTVLRILRLDRIPGIASVLVVALPLAFTILVPYLLIRYRRERLSSYGLGAPRPNDAGLGALLAAPLVAASIVIVAVLAGLDAGISPWSINTASGVVGVLSQLAHWGGLALLGVYTTVKARDAFRQDYVTVREGVERLGRWVVAIAVGALLLLVLAGLLQGDGASRTVVLLMPIGLAGSLLLALRTLRGPSVTSTQVLLTPTVLFALGPFALSLSGPRFVTSVYLAALSAGIGLLVGLLVESRRSAWAPLGLAAAVALLTVADSVV